MLMLPWAGFSFDRSDMLWLDIMKTMLVAAQHLCGEYCCVVLGSRCLCVVPIFQVSSAHESQNLPYWPI